MPRYVFALAVTYAACATLLSSFAQAKQASCCSQAVSALLTALPVVA